MAKRNPRKDAIDALCEVLFKGRVSTDLIAYYQELYRHEDPRDARFFTNLLLGTLRHKLTLDTLINRFSTRAIRTIHKKVYCILLIGLYQIVYLDRVPAHSAVDESVKLAKYINKKVAGYVNAILRKATSNFRDFLSSIDDISVKYSIPDFILNRLTRLGVTKAEYFDRINQPAPLYLRVNSILIDKENFLNKLKAKGIVAQKVPFLKQGVMIIEQPIPIYNIGIIPHLAVAQDAASQLVVELLNPDKDEEILDMCAGKGIKTTQILELTGDSAHVTAVDIDKSKLKSLEELAKLRGVKNFKTINTDATTLSNKTLFDRILLDAPCSGSGTIRRRPEVRYRITSDITDNVRLQKALLKKAISLLKPGGILVYAVCSFLEEEGQKVVDSLLKDQSYIKQIKPEHPNLSSEFLKNNSIFILPGLFDMDGFYITVLKRDGTATTVHK